jgi:hypothetical protein
MGRPVSPAAAWLALFLVLGALVGWLRPLREHVSLRRVVRAAGVSVSEPALVEGEGLGEAPVWSFGADPFQVVVDSIPPLDADEGSWGTDPRDAVVDAAAPLEPEDESGSSSGEDDATSLASPEAQDAAAELAASQPEPRLDGALIVAPAREAAAGAGAGDAMLGAGPVLDRGSQEDRDSEQAAQEARGSQEESGSGSPAGTLGGAQVPVVGFFYSDGAALDATHYQWATLRPAVRHGNRCFVLTNAKASVPDELRAHVTVVPLEGLESEAMRSFKRVYRPMGYKEPFELFNVLRFFYLHEWMRREGQDWVVYLDSDVALLASTQALMQRLARAGPGCDCLVDFGLSRGADRVLWATRKWSVFVGTSALSARVLADYTAFATDMYAPQHAAVLEAKRARGTNVNDMTLWYLFAMAADQRFAAATQAPQSVLDALPRARATHHMCHFADLDHRQSFTDPAFRYDPDTATAQLHGKPLLSVHFQGGTKYLIPRLFRLPGAVVTVSRVGEPTRVFKPRGKG